MNGERAAADCIPNEWDRAGLPPWTYRDDELTEIENDVLFRRHWQLACHVSDVAEPGDYVAFDGIVLSDRAYGVRAHHDALRAAIPVMTLRDAPARGTVAETNGRMSRTSEEAPKAAAAPATG